MSVPRPWIDQYDPWVVRRPAYPRRPLTHVLDRTAAELPDGVATEFLGASLTFAELQARAGRLSAALQQLGLVKGDRIGLMLPNCPQYPICVFGALRIGAIVVNINPAYTPRELRLVARDAGLRALVTLEALLPVVEAVTTGWPIEHIIVTALEEYAAAGSAAVASGHEGPAHHAGGVRTLASLVHAPVAPLLGDGPVSPDDLAVLQYTGGTTGTPKAAMLTHANIFANVIQSVAFMYGSAARGRDRYLMVIPFFHIYGFTVGLVRGLWVGATQRLLPQYRPEQVLDAIRDFEPGYFPAVPTIYVSLLNHPAVTTSGLERVRVFNTGGAPCPLDVIDRFERTVGRPLNEGYGMSESSPAICSTPLLAARKRATVGVPLPDTDVKIVDPDTGTRLPVGEVGELCVSGPQVMRGYWNQPEASAQALRTDDEGRTWLHTGDIARLDDEGFVSIVQRRTDVIIVDAFKVYPSEVESVLMAHPAVAMAAAIGVPDAYHGEVVRAIVVPIPGAAVTPDAMLEHCRTQLAPYKVPTAIAFRDSLPMSAVGKILYRVLRDEASPAEMKSPAEVK